MHTQSASSVHSRQIQAISEAINHFLGNENIKKELGWSWNSIAVPRVTGTAFDQAHRAASVYLSNLTRHPAFLNIRASQALPQTAVFLVDDRGRLYYSWTNLSSLVDITTAWFSPKDITPLVSGLATFDEDLKVLANMAKTTGGWVITGDQILVGQWLRFHGLPAPANEQDAKGLIDLLNFATLPEAPRLGHYWQLLESPKGSPFELTKDNRAIIHQVTQQLTGGYTSLVAHFGEHLRLESTSADRLPSRLGHRLQRLLEIALWASEQGQAYIDALGWFSDASAAKPSPAFIEQLLIAAMLLDLDPAIDMANTAFAGFNLYSTEYFLLHPSTVRTRLEQHLIDHLKLDKLFAPLVVELVLGGMAPQYLIADWPAELRIGTPAWVVATQSVQFAEALVPGISRGLPHEHLLGLSQSSQATSPLASLYASQSMDPIVTWALMNKLIIRDADGSLSPSAITQATREYEQHLGKILRAADSLGKALPHRKPLALKELKANVPGCDPDELLVKHRGSGGGAGRKVSVLDLYMGDELHRQEWDRVKGSSIYQSFPDLTRLYPVTELYNDAIHQHHNAITEALASNIEVTLSQLPPNEALFIENGALGIYCVEQYTTTRFPTLPTPGGVIRPATPLAGDTGRFGVILCAHLNAQVRCYELFPLRLECRANPKLESAFRSLVKPAQNGHTVNFSSDERFERVDLDVGAYSKNQAPRDNVQSRLFVRKIGEFQASADTAAPISPTPFFRSPRKQAISQLIAENNPYFTVEELKQLGLDQTQRERAIEKTEAIFNAVINMIIPFKGCVEEMSSGNPARQQNAILGCVMDVAAIALAVAILPGRIISASAKAANLVTRLLSASRIGARAAVTLINPLDGVPQLLIGGAKLIGKSALKVGHYATSTAHIARAQLQHLTGANAYDLVKAINHTGAASQIRMSLDTVAHARALFKSDALQTPEHVLKHLHANDAKLLKQVPQEELERLLENALIEMARTSDEARSLTKVLGTDVVDSLIRQQAQKYSLANVHQFKEHTALPEIFNDTLKVEHKNLIAMNQHQSAVLASDLGQAPYHRILDDVSYNPQRLTDNADRATAWILNASSSRNETDNIRAVLRDYASNGKPLNDPAVYRELHRRLVPEAPNTLRSPSTQARYPSNVSGAAMLEQHLATLDPAHEHFGKQLFGAFLGYHSFVDGNGRVSRAIYAITELRGQRFNALHRSTEDALSGLN